jgi:hypothetical protein
VSLQNIWVAATGWPAGSGVDLERVVLGQQLVQPGLVHP